MPAMWGLKPACQRMWGLKSPLRELGWSPLRELGWSLLRELGWSLLRELGWSLLRKLGWSLLREFGWSLLLLLSPPPRTWRVKSPVYPLERSGGFLTAIR